MNMGGSRCQSNSNYDQFLSLIGIPAVGSVAIATLALLIMVSRRKSSRADDQRAVGGMFLLNIWSNLDL